MAMDLTSAQTIIASTTKKLKIANKTGKLNMESVALFNLISYYVNFTKGVEECNREHNFLLTKLTELKNNFNDELCTYSYVAPTTTSIVDNTAPIADNETLDLLSESIYQFKLNDFLNSYSDAENNSWKNLIVNPSINNNGSFYSLSSDGVTKIPFNNPIQFNVESFELNSTINLYYERSTEGTFNGDLVTFRVSDNDINFLYSPIYSLTINASLSIDGVNQLPTIGDNTIYVSNRSTTILTLAMFTTDTTLPYSDFENDTLDALRINKISNENVGLFYLNNIEINEGDIITRADIESNLFTHVAPDQNGISSDVFDFSIRDTGSPEFTEYLGIITLTNDSI